MSRQAIITQAGRLVISSGLEWQNRCESSESSERGADEVAIPSPVARAAPAVSTIAPPAHPAGGNERETHGKRGTAARASARANCAFRGGATRRPERALLLSGAGAGPLREWVRVWRACGVGVVKMVCGCSEEGVWVYLTWVCGFTIDDVWVLFLRCVGVTSHSGLFLSQHSCPVLVLPPL